MKNTLKVAAASAVALLCSFANAQKGVALTDDNRLVSFQFSGTTPSYSTPVGVTGLQGGEKIVGVDFRPVDRSLVAVTNQNRLLSINPASGSTRLLSSLSTALDGTIFGVDFNPVPDRLRIVSNTGQNLRVNVDTGAVTTDGPLAYDAGDAAAGMMPNVSAAAYTNSVAGKLAMSTTLYDIDYTRDVLVRQDPPNNGVLKTVGPLGIDADASTTFDILSPSMGMATVAGKIYQIDLMTGAATAVADLPAGAAVVGMSLYPKEMAAGIVNTSARGMVGMNSSTLIVGFVVEGDAPINVLVVARGPSLAQFGVESPVADTKLAIYRGMEVIESNDNWNTGAKAAQITASGFAPGSSTESAVMMTLAPGVYTAHVWAAEASMMGIGIVEVYELP